MGIFKDLTGKRFGRWTVIKRGPDHITSGGYKFTTWHCKCDCGNENDVIASRLLAGRSISCGCIRIEKAKEYEDLTGRKYNRLLVLHLDETDHDRIKWICRCDCGNISSVRSWDLKNNRVKSCGCLTKETARIQGLRNTKHGGDRRNATREEKRLYNIWSGMKTRCNNPNDDTYKYYGAKGISYCSEWEDFAEFQNWALENGYANNLTLDRIDGSGNYEPDNCRWCSYYVQNNNRKNTIRLTINNETHSLGEWCKISGIPYKVAYARYRSGWDPCDAIFKKINKNE